MGCTQGCSRGVRRDNALSVGYAATSPKVRGNYVRYERLQPHRTARGVRREGTPSPTDGNTVSRAAVKLS